MPGPLLILIPTALEQQTLQPLLNDLLSRGAVVELCGFGPIAAGVRSMHSVLTHRPRHVLLLGIAGALAAELDIGAAYEFSEVVCYGIGAGDGSHHRTLQQMGWQHLAATGEQAIEHCLPLHSHADGSRQLLTVCAAAGDATDVNQRRQHYPQAAAEDMEGFAVAAACRLSQTPLSIIRGISNRAGDRQTHAWQIAPALQAAGQLANQCFAGHE